MEAGACACDSGGPYAEFFKEMFPKARKEHVCCECRETIRPGEIYQKITAMSEGHFYTYKTCLPCSKIREDYAPCSYFEFLDDAIAEVLGIHLDGTPYWLGDDEDDA